MSGMLLPNTEITGRFGRKREFTMASDIKITQAGSAAASALSAQKGGLWKRDDFKVREFDRDVTLAQIRKAVIGNNLDEVVFQTSEGKKYALYADELVGKVQVGDEIAAAGLRGTVVFIDNEWNESRVAAGAIAAATIAGVVGGAAIGMSMGAGAGFFAPAAQALGAFAGAPLGGSVAAGTASFAAGLQGAFHENDAGIKTLSNEVRPMKK